MPNRIDISGQKFHRLTALSWTREMKGTKPIIKWVCRCDCGNTTKLTVDQIRKGIVKSCGCLLRDISRARLTTHGGKGTRLYRIWKGMTQRCANPNNPRYSRWGGRGITVCDAWRHSFETFRRDMGNPPSEDHSIDRIDNNEGYRPDNCRWSTALVQSNNSSKNVNLTFSGQTLTISQWARHIGVRPSLIHARIVKLGWPVEKALTAKIRGH